MGRSIRLAMLPAALMLCGLAGCVVETPAPQRVVVERPPPPPPVYVQRPPPPEVVVRPY
jgi:hypothetical protein